MLMILAVGVILAAVSVYLIHMYLTPKRVTVWLFNDNYKAGTALTDDMLYAVQADAKIVVAGAKTDTNTQFVTGAEKSVIVNSGDSLRIDVSAGMPLTKSILSVNGGTSVEMGMDPSKVCVTIPCTSTSGITDDLMKGSRVNVYATGYNDTGMASTVLIFQNMKVANTSKKDGIIQSLTLEVTVEESLKLINQLNYSTLYFGLVDSTGYQYAEDELSYTANVHPENRFD